MAAYSLYDLLRTLVMRVGMPTEEERTVALESINEAERMGILGNLARDMVCEHTEVGHDGKCTECQKIIHTGQSPSRFG